MLSELYRLLVGEHDIILKAGDNISTLKNSWNSDPEEYKQRINQLLDFFTVYADKYHHLKEEEILFPAMSKKNEIVAGSIIQELLDHHESFRLLLGNIRVALEDENYELTHELLEEYVSTLQEHIAVENDELFPMADNLFTENELENMFYKCVDMDKELGLDHKEEWAAVIKS